MSDSRKTKIGYEGMRGGTEPPASLPPGFEPSAEAGEGSHAGKKDGHDPDLLGGCYQLLRPLGAGGMSEVYLARHERIGKQVAIKVLADKHRGKAVLVERFLLEARATAQVDHPNVIDISDFGETPQGAPYFVMEYLEGESLGETLRREGPLPWPRVAHFLLQIAEGLAAAHDLGVVHRDLKPDNCIRVSAEGDPDFIKIIDFGVAKLLGEQATESGRLTKTGIVVGTPEYVAPEQAQGQEVDHRVDIYALGVLMTELLTGKLPFTGESYVEVLMAQSYDPAPRFAELAPSVEVPDGVEAIARKALQKQPDHRFESMAAFAEAIVGLGVGRRLRTMDDDAAGRPEVVSPMRFADQAAKKAARWRWIGPLLAGVGLLALGASLTLVWRAGDEPKADQAQASPPREEAAATELGSVAASPQLGPVSVIIETNVEAEIIDPETGASLGWTNAPEGFELARGKQPIPLRLVAEGYADYDFQLVPSGDRRFRHELERVDDEASKRQRKPRIKEHEQLKNPFGAGRP
ncbi:serine/threonine protein kinase [Pseudenhygromyxa sp. WMMC2535]|uniref:serine/threonine-protein kinase n=1 Tax=Pseudenhygromyxa sp. WMMC2535 TaxID=2712867 RepID=UPI0015564767|nr:serine/threonine-protein kinase [Pseudenhygromyxa sp. WMMC2535]NVB41115.1 serine/threonine protein kinase [Pseudenhygromyxa sp. WMMC2535]